MFAGETRRLRWRGAQSLQPGTPLHQPRPVPRTTLCRAGRVAGRHGLEPGWGWGNCARQETNCRSTDTTGCTLANQGPPKMPAPYRQLFPTSPEHNPIAAKLCCPACKEPATNQGNDMKAISRRSADLGGTAIATLSLAAACALPAYAQTQVAAVGEVEEVVVTATPIRDSIVKSLEGYVNSKKHFNLTLL